MKHLSLMNFRRKIHRSRKLPLFFCVLLSFLLLVTLPTKILDRSQIENIQSDTTALAAPHRDSKTHKVVLVGYTETVNFSEGMSDNAKKYGMAYDYLQKVSYYTNWDYVYVYGDWDGLMKKLINGEIDALAGVSKIPERIDKMLFPEYAMGHEEYYIYTKADNKLAYESIEGLSGHTVSVNSSTTMYDILQQWNKLGNYNINIVTYTSNIERYKDFNQGKADATVDTNNTIRTKDNLVPIAQIGQSEFYLAINKNRPDLVNDLNAALNKINSMDPNFTNKLTNSYFSNQAITSHLQYDELAWLNEHPVITVGFIDNYLPLSDLDDDGQINGVVKDILNEMASRLNIENKVQFVYVPFKSYKSMIASLKCREIDVAFPVNNDVFSADEADIFLSAEVLNFPMYLIYTGDYADLNLRRMSVIKGNTIGELFIKKHFPQVEIVAYDTIEDMLKAVKHHEADGCILNQFHKDGYLVHVDFSNLNAIILNDYSSRSFAVNWGNNELLSIINRGITNLPGDFALNSTSSYVGMLYSMTLKDYILRHIIAFMIIAGTITAILSGLLAYIYIIQKNKRKMRYLANHDSLTGLHNRHSYRKFTIEYNKQDVKKDIIIAVMDINSLKIINDTLGHDAGDELITGAAKCMKKFLSPHGEVYRMGGDEFMAVIHHDLDHWSEILQSLRDAFNAWSGKIVKSLSVSIGIASNQENKALTLEEMIAIADKQMYAEKAAYYSQNGHNRRINRD